MGGCRHGIRRQHHLTDFVDDPPLGFHEAIAFRHGCLWSCGCGRGFRDFGQAPILPDGGGTGGVAGLGETGFVVEPDNVSALIEAVGKIDQIDRNHCRHVAETEFTLETMGDRLEAWFQKVAGL